MFFLSLIRMALKVLWLPLMLRILDTYVRESKRNLVFLFVFCSLNRTFDLSVLGTVVRESKRNLVFLFVFCSLNRTFDLMVLGTCVRE